MSVATFIPTIWNARLLANLDNEHVATEFVNRDYEGGIKQKGDKVKVNSIGEISIKKYNKDADIDDAEDLTTEDQDLTIDQGDYFNFKVNDVDRVQAAGTLMDKAMQRASYGLSQNSDAYIFSTMATGAGTKVGTSAKATYLTSANAYSPSHNAMYHAWNDFVTFSSPIFTVTGSELPSNPYSYFISALS